MELSDFVIELRLFTLEEAAGIPCFKDVDTIADITDEDFLQSRLANSQEKLQDNNKRNKNLKKKPATASKQGQRQYTSKKNITLPVRLPCTPIVPCRSLASQRRPNSMQTSTPIVNRQKPHLKSVHINPNNLPKVRAMRLPKEVPISKTQKDDFSDIIPPDVDVVCLDLDKLLLTPQEFDESDYDTVSNISSDSDSYSEYCDTSENLLIKPFAEHMPDTSRPGVKLDAKLVEPSTREKISTFPTATIYSCEKPKCGFTTSNIDYIRLHSCR